MDAIAPVLPGETVAGKYRVERVLGRGGMGIVVAARHLALDERVAIKFLLGSPSDASAERFLREARAAAKVKGEHVCRVFDFGRLETGEPYIVMDYLEGMDLARKLEREGPQPVARVVGWVIEVCGALADAHANGIVHRDLKPANVFLAERADGSTCAKVLDFGISKLARAETMTGPATTMGSPVYMSPEQMESARDVDGRSDIWSLGVMIYELIAGKPPFVAESMVQLTVLVRERREDPLELVRRDVPEALARVVTRCLEKRPEARFATVADLVTALAPHAPDDVTPLVARLVRRRTSDPAMALARTAPAPEGAPRVALDRTETSAPLQGSALRGTFAPVQSSVAERESLPPSWTPRWALPVVASTLLIAMGIGTLAVAASPQEPDSAGHTVSAAVAESAALLHAEPPTPMTTTGATTALQNPLPVTASSANARWSPSIPIAPQKPAAKAGPSPTPPIVVAVAASGGGPSSAPSASVAIARTPAPEPARAKRELDRDDP